MKKPVIVLLGLTLASVMAGCTDDGWDENKSDKQQRASTGCETYLNAKEKNKNYADLQDTTLSAVLAEKTPTSEFADAALGRWLPDVNYVSAMDSGEFTLLLPINAAVTSLPDGPKQTLRNDVNYLNSTVASHLLYGNYELDELDGQVNLAGGNIELGEDDAGRTTINGAGVLCDSIDAQNSRIYIIDSVILPDGVVEDVPTDGDIIEMEPEQDLSSTSAP